MINIRVCIFETNSSSTHCFVVVSNKELQQLLHEGAYLLCNIDNKDANNVIITWSEPKWNDYPQYSYYVTGDRVLRQICSFDDKVVLEVDVFEY